MSDEVTEPGFPQGLLAELRDPQFDFVAQQLRASLRRTVLGRESPPARAGRFIVLRPAGRGAMGLVYEAYDPDLERKVAIKVLRARGASGRAALLREGRALARLSHPNIVTVFEVGTLDDARDPSVFVAMELVGGGTLRRWLEQAPQSRERVLEMFVAIGDALAAAHREGVVHGDFKPDNVLLDTDGRPKVVDFGLARVHRAPPPTVDDATTPATPLMSGPFGGTPAYAAPEIADGAPPDARADQFSFCMALAEALWGERPRRGRDESLVLPPRGTVPQWLTALVETGLQREPAHRHASMAALVERLRRDPHALRRHRAALALVGVAVVAAAATAVAVSRNSASCPDPAPMIASTWNPTRRAELREGLLGSELPFAADLVERVLHGVDRHDERWQAEMLAACQATIVERVQSQEVLDRRRACLERNRRDLDVTIAVIEERGADSLMRALDAVDGLSPPSRCAEIGTLERVPSPEEADMRAAIGDHIGRASAYHRMNTEPEAAMREATAASELAERLGDPREISRASTTLGRAHDRFGQFEEARLAGERALWLAYRNDDHEQVVRAATLLGWVFGFRRNEPDVAGVYLSMGETAAEKVELGARMRADLLEAMAASASMAAEYERAIERFEAALAVRRATGDEQDEARTLENLAEVEIAYGRVASAREHIERAREIWQRVLPAEHPSVAHNEFLLGQAMLEQGESVAGLAHAEHAYAAWVQVYPPSHHESIVLLRDLGRLAHKAGELERAAQLFERTLPLLEAEGDRTQVALSHALLGRLALDRRDAPAAQQHFQQALSIWTSVSPDAHPFVAETEINLAAIALDAGDRSTAAKYLERATATSKALPDGADQFLAKVVPLRARLDAMR